MANETKPKGIYAQLRNVQFKLKAPKGQFNSHGRYKYRSCEDIMEALKPILVEEGLTLHIKDSLELVGARYYIKATAVLVNDNGETIENTAFAREDESRKGMDTAQLTGATSSYCRKYCLNGLFLIDDTKDADTDEYANNKANNVATQAPNMELINAINMCNNADSLQALYDSLSPQDQNANMELFINRATSLGIQTA